jgi:MFS transporter, ACS family, glucarate transporter
MTSIAERRSDASVRRASQVRWLEIAPTLFVVWVVSMFDKSNMSIVMNDKGFLTEFGLVGQQAKLGWLSSGLFLSYGLFAPLWGFAVDKIGARLTAILALLIWAFTCFWSSVAPTYGQLLASRIVLGAGEAALFPVTLALVANWYPLKERGRATSIWWVGALIGPSLVGLMVTPLILSVGWRLQFIAVGLLALVLPLPMLLLLARDRPDLHRNVNPDEAALIAEGSLERNEDAPGRALRTVRNDWTNYRFWLTTLAIGSNAIFFWGWSIWLPTYLRTQRHFSFGASGYLTFVIYGVAFATILIAMRLSDRLFRRAPIAAVGWVLAAAFLIGAALAANPVVSVILMTCALCAQQVSICCAETLMHSIVAAARMGRMQGVRAFVAQVISALSPAMIGYIVQWSGGFTGAFLSLAIAVAVSGGCMVALAIEGF